MKPIALLGAVSICLVALACSEIGPRIRPGTLATAQRELDLTREAGFPARIVAVDHFEDLATLLRRARDEAPAEVTLVGVSPHDYRVDFGAPLREPAVSALVRARVEAEIDTWVRRFLQAGDVDGAVRAAARSYTLALRENDLLAPGRPLPPFNPPNARARKASPHTTYHWGAPLSLAVLGVGLVIRKRAGSAGL